VAHKTLAKRIEHLDSLKHLLMMMDKDAANENDTWSDPQWDAYHTEYKQLEDSICIYEHTPLMEC